MTIIEFLVKDHDKLRRDIAEIQEAFLRIFTIRDKLKTYITDFELHETVEQRFFISEMEKITGINELEDLQNLRKNHNEVWSLLDKLSQVINTQNLRTMQQSLSTFSVFMEEHMKKEMDFLLTTQKLMDQSALQKLGEEAEKYCEQFFNLC